MFAGSIELMKESQDLSYVKDLLLDFMEAIKTTVILSLDIELATYLVESLDVMTTELIKKKKEGMNVSEVERHLPQMLSFLLEAKATFMTYKLQKKGEPDDIKV